MDATGQGVRSGVACHFFDGSFGVAIEPPSVEFEGDALPGVPLLRRAHSRPMLNLGKGAAATFAVFVALACRADGNAGCVWSGRVPLQPCKLSFWRQIVLIDAARTSSDHLRVHDRQGFEIGMQGQVGTRGGAVPMKGDRRFEICEMKLRHQTNGSAAIAFEEVLQLCAVQGAHLRRDQAAVTEKHQGRDAPDAKASRRSAVLVDVHLDHFDLAGLVFRKLVKQWRDHLAWAAPRRPEIDHDSAGCVRDVGIERIVRRVKNCVVAHDKNADA